MSFVLVRDRSRLGHKPDCRLGWLSEYVRKSMYAWHSVSVACRPAETRRRRGEIGSIRRSILVGHRRPNRPQRVKTIEHIFQVSTISKAKITRRMLFCCRQTQSNCARSWKAGLGREREGNQWFVTGVMYWKQIADMLVHENLSCYVL